ncbi:MAG: tripartite tricarboxylate transporter TctB family protein [Thermosphaera sp.]
MARRDIFIAAALLALAGGYAYMILQIPARRQVFGPGPTVMPWLLALLLAFLCVLLVIKALRTEQNVGERRDGMSLHQVRDGSVFIGLLTGYGIAMRYLGFEIPSFLFLLAASRLIGGGSLVKSAFWAVVLTAGIYIIFTKIFSVPLPRAPWW